MFKKFILISFSAVLISFNVNAASDGELILKKNQPAEIKDCSNLGIIEKKACQSKNVGNKIGNKMPSFLKKGFEKMKESNRELK